MEHFIQNTNSSSLNAGNNSLLERYEYDSFLILEKVMISSFASYLTHVKTLSFDDLLQYLCRQSEGRSRKYQYSLEQALEHHFNNTTPSAMTRLEKEFRMRLISSPFLKVAPERFIHDSVVRWLIQNGISYQNYYCPNSSDFAIILENSQISQLENMFSINYDQALPPDYDGILLNIDSKSINGVANLGDALVDSLVGKFEAKWNQISYQPPCLRSALAGESPVIQKRHAVLNPYYNVNQKRYFTVTLFFNDLAYVPSALNLFSISTHQINGSIFEHVGMIACIPNGILQSTYYDQFFDKGKGGYDKKSPHVPLDTRIKIKSGTDILNFQNLPQKGVPKRYAHFIDRGSGTISASILDIEGCGFTSCKIYVP